MVGALEREHGEMKTAVARAREPGLLGIDEAQVGRVEPGLAHRADRRGSRRKVGEAERGGRAVGGAVPVAASRPR